MTYIPPSRYLDTAMYTSVMYARLSCMQVLAPTTACCQDCTFSLFFLVVGIHMNSSDLNEILSQEVWMNIRQFFALY